MLDNIIDDTIIIDIEIFNKKRKNIENNNSTLEKNIEIKYNELIKTYNCFNIKYDPKSVWEKKKFKNKNLLNNKNKLYTFTSLSNNNSNKKIIIGILNKITENNKNVLLNNIYEIFNNSNNSEIIEFFEIVFNYIYKKYDNIYIEILKKIEEINNNIIYDYFNKYIDKKLWYPDIYIINNNILCDNLYDKFCEYIKWKTKQINIINTYYNIIKNNNRYLLLNDKLYSDLYNELTNFLNNNSYKYLVDYVLEIITILLKDKDNDNYYIKKIENIDISKINNSTKFLIYDIIRR